MSAEKTAINVEAIEAEAEKTLQAARARANEILLKANEEASGILNSGAALEQVKKDCENMIKNARKESDARIEEARIKAVAIKDEMSKKGKGLVSKMVNDVAGVALK
jgi:cell division septum initiation protein DivIVA